MAGVYHPQFYDLLWYEALANGTKEKGLQSLPMFIAIFFMRLLEVMFFAGIAGSAVVVVISFIEDIQLLVGE